MRIHKVRVLLSKGWFCVMYCITFIVFSIISSFSSAKSLSQDKDIKAGDMISGIVISDRGGLTMVTVTERDAANRIVANAVTDFEGKFSFKLVDPKDRIVIDSVKYEIVDIPIDKTYLRIKMKEKVILHPEGPVYPIPLREAADSVNTIDMSEFEHLM